MSRTIGKLVYFRPVERSDIDGGWHQWINDPVANEHLFGAFPINKDELQRYYEGSQPPGSVMFAVCAKENDRYIGNARLGSIDWVNRICTYGRLIGDPEYRGKGYGTDALLLLLRYGFHTLGMNRIWSTADSLNAVSLRSNEKIGMKQEGRMREALYRDGAFRDTIILSMLRRDFDELYGPAA